MANVLQIKNLKDYREKLVKHETKYYATRPLTAITHIAIHHSATKTGSAEAFARFHVKNLGWPGIGYHFVIEKNGLIKWTNDLHKKSYHVGNSNKIAVGICLTGDFSDDNPSKAQWDSLYNLVKGLMDELSINPDHVWGHSEFPGYESKPCPCIDMTMVRERLIGRSPAGNLSPGMEAETAKYRKISEIINRFSFMDFGALKKMNPTVPLHSANKAGLRVKGGEERVPPQVRQLIRALESKNYAIFRDESKNHNLNIVGVRNEESKPNSFDDEIHVFWCYERQWQYRKYQVTTDPGLTYLEQPIAEEGTAILKEGQYRGAYRLGKHRGKYKALVQAKPLTVIRDFDRDNRLDFSSGREQTGFFGINIHRASATGKSTLVNKWSAGCQVFASSSEYDEFIKLCELSSTTWGNSFTYTLLNKSDLD